MKAPSRLSEPKMTQSVIEWRYSKAHRYWDDCGKVIAAIEQAIPGLKCRSIEKDGFVFDGTSAGLNAASFYWNRATVTQVGRNDSSLAEGAGLFWSVLQTGLAIETQTRLGHRSWLLFETATVQQAAKWLDGFALWRFGAEIDEAFGHPMAMGSVLRTRLEPGGRRMRMEVNAATLAPKAGSSTRPEAHGVAVDVDLVAEAPDPVPADVMQFVRSNQQFLRNTVVPVFRKK